MNYLGKIENELLYKSLDTLMSKFRTKVKIEKRKGAFVISGIRPVVIKATVEKAIDSGELERGRVSQYENAVKYVPSGGKKMTNNYYEVEE